MAIDKPLKVNVYFCLKFDKFKNMTKINAL